MTNDILEVPAAINSMMIPVMTFEAFAQAVGLEPGCVRAAAYRGFYPTVKIGRKRLINVEALRILAAKKAGIFTL